MGQGEEPQHPAFSRVMDQPSRSFYWDDIAGRRLRPEMRWRERSGIREPKEAAPALRGLQSPGPLVRAGGGPRHAFKLAPSVRLLTFS